MNWYSIGFAALSAAIAALLGRLVFGRDPSNKTAANAVVGIVFFILTAFSHLVLVPKVTSLLAKTSVEAELQSVPAFVSIKKFAPDTYREMSKAMIESIEQGRSRQEAIKLVRGHIERFVVGRLPHASDTALLAYVGVMVEEMGELQSKQNHACYQFLFPQAGGTLNLTKQLTRTTQLKDLAALDEVIKTSNTKRRIPKSEEVVPYVQPTIMALEQKYGDSMAVLDKPLAPGVDKEKVCTISRELFQGVLALPPAQAAPSLRWMFSQK